MEQRAAIDLISRSKIEGWVIPTNNVSLIINGKVTHQVTTFYKRQDLVDAGVCDGDNAFSVDATALMSGLEGEVKVELVVNGDVIIEKKERLKSNTALNENPFLELKTFNEVEHWKVNSSHRSGMSFNSFRAPQSLKESNGFYTRISFLDKHNTKTPIEILPSINSLDAALKNLQVLIVAKASQDLNLHIRVVEGDAIIFDEPVLISKQWQQLTVDIDNDVVQKLISANAELKFTTKHYGKRFIDFASIIVAEETDSIEFEDRKLDEPRLIQKQNLLGNGELRKWNRGVDFSEISRGQELADNWFIEFHKSNTGNVAVATVLDTYQQDMMAEGLPTSFGLRVKTKELVGYNRVICSFRVIELDCYNHRFQLEIESLDNQCVFVLPRISLIARDGINDKVVCDIARKEAFTGRANLSFDLDARKIEHIINMSGDYPTLCVAIDIPSNSDIAIYSTSLSVVENEAETEQNLDCVSNIPLRFEDESILEQLKLLKGIDTWSSSETVLQSELLGSSENNEKIEFSNSFLNKVLELKPHKMRRPSRTFPTVDVIVPVYNACDDVLYCLASLIEKTDIMHRVIIINDGDDERTAQMLDAFSQSFNHLEIITNEQNLGYTKSVNKGIRHSNSDWVVVLNSDTIVSEGWLGRLMNCALTDSNVGMVGAMSNAASWQSVPNIHDESGDWNLNPIPQGMSVDDVAELVNSLSERAYPEVGVINGFCQLINMTLLDKIGLLDEEAFPVGYGEENDMCARAVKAGFKLLIADDTYVYHAKSKSFGHEKRKVLAKQGSKALKSKHPDVDWARVTKDIFENEALVSLREKLAEQLIEEK